MVRKTIDIKKGNVLCMSYAGTVYDILSAARGSGGGGGMRGRGEGNEG